MKKETKEKTYPILIIVAVVYVILWITHPRDVDRPLPEPLDESTIEAPSEDRSAEKTN